MTEKNKLLQRDDSNPVYYIISVFELLLQYYRDNSLERAVRAEKLLQSLHSIFKSETTARVLFYFIEHKAATGWLVQVHLHLPEVTAYYILRKLRKMGFIVPAKEIRKQVDSKGGPRPTVWALVGSHQEEVAAAIRLHYRSLSPKYLAAEKVAQSALTRFSTIRVYNTVTQRQLVDETRRLEVNYKVSDVAEIALEILHEKGVQVIR